jgi:hypothetical protein
MSKHTVGPWEYDAESAQVIAPKCGYQWVNGAPVIAEVCPLDYSEQSENARLIAAAPDLLNALEAMLAYAPEPAAYSTACVHERARAAIAKATGAA